MTEVTREQREAEIRARDNVKKAAEETRALTEAEERQKLIEGLTIRDRLMRRLKTSVIEIVVHDDLGDFPVKTRLMTSTERAMFIEYNKQLESAKGDPKKNIQGNPELYNDAMNGLKGIAAEIAVEPSSDWYDGPEVSDDLVTIVLIGTFNGAASYVTDAIASFRPN